MQEINTECYKCRDADAKKASRKPRESASISQLTDLKKHLVERIICQRQKGSNGCANYSTSGLLVSLPRATNLRPPKIATVQQTGTICPGFVDCTAALCDSPSLSAPLLQLLWCTGFADRKGSRRELINIPSIHCSEEE